MKTSARHPSPMPPGATGQELFPATVTYTGVLMCDAQARTMPVDDEGHMVPVPVLVLEIELTCNTRNHHRALQRFPPGQHEQCVAAAKRYRQGMVVDVQMPLASVRTRSDNTTHIHVHQPEGTPA